MFLHSWLAVIMVIICFLFWVALVYTKKDRVILQLAGWFFLISNTIYWLYKL